MFLRAVMVGPPGSGKGTLSKLVVENFGLKHISSGDLLRTSLSKSASVELSMKQGKLIPDETIEKVVFPELSRHASWLLDGFPRTSTQAQSLMKQHPVDVVINLNVPDRTIIERLQGRWVHIASGRIYHSDFNPPKVNFVDDVTGEALVQRNDDLPSVVQQRLSTYHKEIDPVLKFFQGLKLLKTYTGTESRALWPEIQRDIKKLLEYQVL